jgi:integrase
MQHKRMEIEKIPAKFNRCGIKIKCMKCKWQLNDGKCHEDRSVSKSINKCNHKGKHRYNAIVCVPKTKNSRKTKILKSRNFADAQKELIDFKKELILNGYQPEIFKKESGTTIVDFTTQYLDTLSGVNTKAHLIRNRTKDHVKDSARVLERFCLSLKSKHYNIEILDLKEITDNEVEIFHFYILDIFSLGEKAYNRHFAIMKAFFNWVIQVKNYHVVNPFGYVELTFEKKEKIIITKLEFERLLTVINYENGFYTSSGIKRNVYHDWLPIAFRLGLETGLRKEELLTLKWSDLKEYEPGQLIFELNNLKVNRIKNGEDKGTNFKYVPVTNSLKNLLEELGLAEKQNTNQTVLSTPSNLGSKYVMDTISRAFSCYIKLVSERNLQFKSLRKTYITHLTKRMGNDAKLFTGHASNEVLKDHYISGAFMAGGLSDFNLFS